MRADNKIAMLLFACNALLNGLLLAIFTITRVQFQFIIHDIVYSFLSALNTYTAVSNETGITLIQTI